MKLRKGTIFNNVAVFEFDHYCRSGVIDVKKAQCGVCKETTQSLVMDNSDGEYSSIVICRSCLDKLWG